MWFVLSSNTTSGHTAGDKTKDQGGPLKRILDLLWIKISERFGSVHEAYRYFDVNFNNRVSFNEFQKGLDHMRIKFQVDELINIFEYMDRGDKGYISYGDFCELCEEKRRHLDPVESVFPSKEEHEKKAHLKKGTFYNTFLDDCNLEDLEEMARRFGGHYINRRQKNTMRLAHKD